MHITSIEIENIKSISRLAWEVQANNAAGWHVIVGDNGSGKSSFLRAAALALVGPDEAPALRQDWGRWLRYGKKSGTIKLEISIDDCDSFSQKGRTGEYTSRGLHLVLRQVIVKLDEGTAQDSDKQVKIKTVLESTQADDSGPGPERHAWGSGDGWFSASFGPMRRFSGGDREYEKLFYKYPKLSRHLSMFDERVALTECLDWLRDLRFKQLEQNGQAGNLLDHLKEFINQEGFLPHRAVIKDITSDAVTFEDGNGCRVNIEELSDGYRSILSLTLELVRQLAEVYRHEIFAKEGSIIKIVSPGTVLVDEIDAHLHPTWQRAVGLWFRRHFPNMQFIVSSHSPLVCQAADVGTVYRLPAPGSDAPAGFVTGLELDRLLYGSVLEAYDTGVFGEITRSEEAKKKLTRLAELNRRAILKGLDDEEKKERERLRAAMPTAAASSDIIV